MTLKTKKKLLVLVTVSTLALSGCAKIIPKSSSFSGGIFDSVIFNSNNYNVMVCQLMQNDKVLKPQIAKQTFESKPVDEGFKTYTYYYSLFSGDLLYTDDPDFNNPNIKLLSSYNLSFILSSEEIKDGLSYEEAVKIDSALSEQFEMEKKQSQK